ncbi:MAG TPA: PAS domain S-box protein, partial [Smithellaceae bacterium]|nr:PAS domain S-box protein [Smithellaceae bacterium]
MKRTAMTNQKLLEEIAALKEQNREMKEAAANHAQVEEDLRKRCRYLSDLVEYSGNIICIKDREGRYELVNRKWEEVTGWKRGDVIGRTCKELFPGPVCRQFEQNDNEVMESGLVTEMEETLENGQGMRYFITIKFPLRCDDGIIGRVGIVVTEITARKQAEIEREAALDELSKSRSLVRAITDSARDAILMMDPAGCVSFWNPAAEKIFGYTNKEAVGANLHQLIAPERFQEAHYKVFNRLKKTGRSKMLDKTV